MARCVQKGLFHVTEEVGPNSELGRSEVRGDHGFWLLHLEVRGPECGCRLIGAVAVVGGEGGMQSRVDSRYKVCGKSRLEDVSGGGILRSFEVSVKRVLQPGWATLINGVLQGSGQVVVTQCVKRSGPSLVGLLADILIVCGK